MNKCGNAPQTVVVDVAVAIAVLLPDHLADLLVRQLLSETRHDLLQLGRRDQPVPVLVEHL